MIFSYINNINREIDEIFYLSIFLFYNLHEYNIQEKGGIKYGKKNGVWV